jgi:glycosyltransferase involved in cell wall biosynthesis
VPRVSVIIPAYNAEAYLPETLASVQRQTYHDWEVVVADDASTDATVATAERFGERFTVLRTFANRGPAAARNRALTAASGELIALLDADDAWLPAYLERMVGLYDVNSARGARVGIVACNARLLGPNGPHARTYMEHIRFPAEVTIDRMLVSNPIFGSALAPRCLVDEVGGFCPELFGTEDYDLWLRIVESNCRVVATDEALAVYRLRSGSVSSDAGRMARSFQLTYRRALDRGKLTARQRRIARRQLRLQRAVEQLSLIALERPASRRGLALLGRAAPLILRVAVENPDRWGATARILAGRGSPLSQVWK